MKTIRFLMVGGFLGAGKTTTIGKLAGHYTSQGKNVALVTNDQAYNLVDTETLRGQGFQVGEVPGACFCCKFDDLLSTIDSLSDQQIPDIIIAEPVGSCTDLVATVIEPMKALFGDRFETGPLVVLLKPSHGKKILSNSSKGFSPKAAYIFLKQLEEADAIAINKADRLNPEDLKTLQQLAAEKFPDKKIFAMSARSGQGFEELVAAAESDPIARDSMMEMDYQTYAEGEAELGWLNCRVTAKSDLAQPFELDAVVLDLVDAIGKSLVDAGAEIAHLKVLGQTLENSSIANLVSSEGEPELSLASEIKTSNAELLVNARVAIAPEAMERLVGAATAQVFGQREIESAVGEMQSFRPGKPEPTHRVE